MIKWTSKSKTEQIIIYTIKRDKKHKVDFVIYYNAK